MSEADPPSVTSEPHADLAAALAGRYAIERELGRGGMAAVFLARDLKHDRPVALKVLHSELAAMLGPERFRREITLVAKLQHLHILAVHDSGETPAGQLWFTMPYVEGETLRDRLRRERQLPVADALRITRELASALEYAHAHGVLHRDVKPENVLLTRQADALLADFGIARTLSAAKDGTGLTEPGLAVGTPQYMSPEQAAGERNLDARSDVYALGAVCYEMLTGEPPFIGGSPQAVVAKMLSGEAPSVRVLRSGVSPAIDDAVHRALARASADRWASADAFARALETAERTGATAASRGLGPRVPTGVVLLGVGCLVAVGALFAWRHRGSDAVSVAAGPVQLAVLPFDDEGDTANAYFADGITDEIRGKLAALPALQVIASTSSNRYRHTTEDPATIGRELGVRYLLIGRVRWANTPGAARRVRVDPELIQVGAGAIPTTKWEHPFDAPLTDVFLVQTDIAGQVAHQLQIALTPAAQRTLTRQPATNLDAYTAYLRGREIERNSGLESGDRRASGEFTEAVRRDSTFALAWAALADAQSSLYDHEPTRTHADSARAAMQRAMALDPGLPEVYAAAGRYYDVVDEDLPRALGAYREGLALAPANAVLLRRAGGVESRLGEWQAAVADGEQAVRMDPLDDQALADIAYVYTWIGRYADARGALDRARRLAPTNVAYILSSTTVALDEGDLPRAQAIFRSVPLMNDSAELVLDSPDVTVLDSAQLRIRLALRPDAFRGDRGLWALNKAYIYWIAGNVAGTLTYADSARIDYERRLRHAPDSAILHLGRGWTLALNGRIADVGAECRQAMALIRHSHNALFDVATYRVEVAQLLAIVGDKEHALAELDTALQRPPYATSGARLRIGPEFRSLRGDPHFERLLSLPAAGAPPPG